MIEKTRWMVDCSLLESIEGAIHRQMTTRRHNKCARHGHVATLSSSRSYCCVHSSLANRPNNRVPSFFIFLLWTVHVPVDAKWLDAQLLGSVRRPNTRRHHVDTEYLIFQAREIDFNICFVLFCFVNFF